MADNYQIDKNSKLYQKFLNLKINKNNESSVQKISGNEKPDTVKHTERITNDKKLEQHPVVSKHNKDQDFSMTQKMNFHVTISDIQQAAQIALNQSSYPKKQQSLQSKLSQNNKIKHISHEQFYQESAKIINPHHIDLQQNKSSFIPPPHVTKQKTRQRQRNRQFGNLNRSRQEKITQRSFNNNNNDHDNSKTNNNQNFQITFKKPQIIKQKQTENIQPNQYYQTFQNIQPQPYSKIINNNNLQQNNPIIQNNYNFTLGSKETTSQYKKKYDNLYEKYQQLKQTLQKQRKDKKIQLNSKQQQIELIKQKYFQLRSIQDTLTTQNKRCKDKYQVQNMLRMKFQEQTKELQFKVQQLQDILNQKQNNFKKKSQELNFWKSQQQPLKVQIRNLTGQLQKIQDRCDFLQSQNKMMKKDLVLKQGLIQQLRKNINILIDQNNIAKDQIYKLTIKLYHHQQQNQILKGDINRRIREQPMEISMIQDSYNKSIQQMSPKRRGGDQRYQKIDIIVDKNQKNQEGQLRHGGRKRQFARERAVTKMQKVEQKKQQRKTVTMIEGRQRQMRPQITQRKTQLPTNQRRTNDISSRIQYLQVQLQKRKQMKAMNGKLRRQKIQMQRQLQQLLSK